MAHTILHMRHPLTRHTRQAPIGFSWTSLFFGPITCMFRSDWLSAITLIILTILLFPLGVSWGVWVLQSFFYNQYFIHKLVNQGYQVDHVEGDQSLMEIEVQTGLRLTRFQDPVKS